jgi:diacylglycerol kinase family enzyme
MRHVPSRVVAIVNPETRRNAKRIVEILRASAPREVTLDIHLTTFAGHAGPLAREHAEGADLLVAVGGDGTVGEVAGVCHEMGIPLGIVPAGSTNIIARELRIPTNAQAAARLLFTSATIRRIDAGVCDGKIFLHMAGCGIDSLLFELSRPALKRKVGWIAYVPAAIAAMRRPRSRYTVRSAERSIESVESPLVLIANGPSIVAPRFQLDRGIVLDDGWLDVFVVTATTPMGFARVLASMAMRKLSTSSHVDTWKTRRVEIDAEPAIALELDGDVSARTPVTLEIAPGAVEVVVPA